MRTTARLIIISTLLALVIGCKKDDVTPPEPPVANAGNDQNIQLPASSFTLSGSGTPQGSIKNYTWTRVSGPDNPVINNTSSATTSVSGFSAGTYVFQLQVTSDAGLSATDEVTVTVIPESASAPVANAGADQTVHLPESFFVLSGSGTTQRGNVTNYNWTQVSGPNASTIDNASSATTSVAGFIAGTYSFQLEVTNSFGLTAKDTVIINVIGVQTLTLQPSNITADEANIAVIGSMNATSHDKDLDAEYKKKFLAASPSQSLQVEDELRDKKAVFRRSRIEFLDTPTGIDQSALKGEYSYGNKESLARMPPRTREDGKELPARHFFFFNDKLWKIYEEYKLGPKSNLGTDFDSAVKKLSKVFGAEPVNLDNGSGNHRDQAHAL